MEESLRDITQDPCILNILKSMNDAFDDPENFCSICSGPAVRYCRCDIGEAICANGHMWHINSDGERVEGSSHIREGEQNRKIPHNVCSECSEPALYYCKCKVGEAICANGHMWHINSDGERVEGSSHKTSSYSDYIRKHLDDALSDMKPFPEQNPQDNEENEGENKQDLTNILTNIGKLVLAGDKNGAEKLEKFFDGVGKVKEMVNSFAAISKEKGENEENEEDKLEKFVDGIGEMNAKVKELVNSFAGSSKEDKENKEDKEYIKDFSKGFIKGFASVANYKPEDFFAGVSKNSEFENSKDCAYGNGNRNGRVQKSSQKSSQKSRKEIQEEVKNFKKLETEAAVASVNLESCKLKINSMSPNDQKRFWAEYHDIPYDSDLNERMEVMVSTLQTLNQNINSNTRNNEDSIKEDIRSVIREEIRNMMSETNEAIGNINDNISVLKVRSSKQ